MKRFADIASSTQPATRAFFDYWRSLVVDGQVPTREEWDPGAVKPLLGGMLIYERVNPEHFLVRLMGTSVAERLGYDGTGCNAIDLVSRQDQLRLILSLNDVVDTPCGLYAVVRNMYNDRSIPHVDVELIRLPVQKSRGETALIYTYTTLLHPLRLPKLREDMRLATAPIQSTRFTW